MHRKVAVAIGVALALVAVGCGGSETRTLGRAELVRRVELACRDAQAAAIRESRATRTPDIIQSFRAGQELLIERLEELEGSGSARADFAALKAGARARMNAIETVAAASRADRQRALRSVEVAATAASRKFETAARDLGIEGCS